MPLLINPSGIFTLDHDDLRRIAAMVKEVCDQDCSKQDFDTLWLTGVYTAEHFLARQRPGFWAGRLPQLRRQMLIRVGQEVQVERGKMLADRRRILGSFSPPEARPPPPRAKKKH